MVSVGSMNLAIHIAVNPNGTSTLIGLAAILMVFVCTTAKRMPNNSNLYRSSDMNEQELFEAEVDLIRAYNYMTPAREKWDWEAILISAANKAIEIHMARK